MKKLLMVSLLTCFLLLSGCVGEKQQGKDTNQVLPASLEKNMSEVEESSLVYSGYGFSIRFIEGFDGPFEYPVDESETVAMISFGPKGQMAEGPVGEEERSYTITITKPRSFEELYETETADRTMLAMEPVELEVNTFQVAQYAKLGLCASPILEVLGDEYNYVFRPTCWVDEATGVAYIKEVIGNMTLTK